MCTWIVKRIRSLKKGLSSIAVEFGGLTTQDGINFKYLPYLADMNRFTVSARIYSSANVAGERHYIFSFLQDASGWILYEGRTSGGAPNDHSILFNNKAAANATWSASSSFQRNTWTHVVVTYDRTNVLTADPIIYIDGVALTSTEIVSPAGPIESEVGCELVAGNASTFNDFWENTFEGKIKDLRIYNRILSASEVTTLYNSGTPDSDLVTDGLLFRAFAVKTKNLSNYVDQTLDDNLTVVDDIYGMVGTPHGSPVGRTF